MKFVIDGVSAEDLEQILESELEAIEERHAKGALFFTKLVRMHDIRSFRCCYRSCSALGNLTDIEKLGHAISGAFIATILVFFRLCIMASICK